MTAEQRRMEAQQAGTVDWQNWGPYLSERAWGTVREDYSEHGTAWDAFPHDHARSRAYRWNEDGLGGISDRSQYVCFDLALWNGNDSILKERLFGLSGPEGNHGEDVKEYSYFLDSTPTHSWMRMLYKYPQAAYPYDRLVTENAKRASTEPEYELVDTGIFDDDRYFDVHVSYAKADPNDVLIEIAVTNRGPDPATCWTLPTLWFRNTWSWGYEAGPMHDVPSRPKMHARGDGEIVAEHPVCGTYHLYADAAEELLFTENETNGERLYGLPLDPYVKDSFHRYLVDGDGDAVNPQRTGTKAATLYRLDLASGETRTVRLRLSDQKQETPFSDFASIMNLRRIEADEFYDAIQNPSLTEEERLVQRQALAGMLWSKQLYYYDVAQWLTGDPSGPAPPAERRLGRNRNWAHLNNFDILSMPDTWEYPWYAAWDVAFHTLPLALVDAGFSKHQLLVLTREWYMHPNGQIPAYEWAFGDVNPPVHAWATRRVYEIDAARNGRPDRAFLEEVFHKLLLNFTWWVNRKDADGNNVFQGGFLGLDNISVFDRSAPLPTGGHIDQSDGTAWMGFYTLEMLRISLELAKENPVYQGVATKFFEHFLAIAEAMTDTAGGPCLWDDEDGFYYDVLHLPDGSASRLKVRSLVGLLPLIATDVIEPSDLDGLGAFQDRMRWYIDHRPRARRHMASIDEPGAGKRRLISLLTPDRLRGILRYMLDEAEFLSPYGIRSLSKIHAEQPFRFSTGGQTFEIGYEPAESQGGVFGGNSNWRGPVWFPVNYLIIETLRELHHYYGEAFTVEMPTGSGTMADLNAVADELQRRLTRLFITDETGGRPIDGGVDVFSRTNWSKMLAFHEYFDGDTGKGLGASHQTGWTGLIASLLQG